MTLDELNASLVRPPFPKLSGNIYCIGRNYVDHVKELQNEIPEEPVVFLKSPASLRPLHSDALACATESFHHEIELVIMVKHHIKMSEKADISAIGAITLGIDLTRRTLQNELKAKGLPWTLAKSFAGAGLLHSFQTFPKDAPDIEFSLSVNGEERQRGHSKDMVFDFRRILNFLLKYQDLYPGDIIYTGTPAGVAAFKKGDSFQVVSKLLNIDAKGVL
ncbi:MAG: fumarylacetoacetate hydrolase family protein [Chitinophagaceae bacterium]|nr:fumarylacetoacetate hydrolase family protein [Oligoflexus sp.]